MVITPDNKTLIISESFTGRLIAFDIEATGLLSNRRVWAEGLGPDGICMDAEGAVWVQTADVRAHSGRDDAPEGAVVRIREGGEVLQRSYSIRCSTSPPCSADRTARRCSCWRLRGAVSSR